MMIYDVELWVDCILIDGDINEGFQNSLEGVFEDAIALIKKTGNPEMIEAFHPRIRRNVANTYGIVWEFHAFISDVYHTQ